jgi:hypothetical protein
LSLRLVIDSEEQSSDSNSFETNLVSEKWPHMGEHLPITVSLELLDLLDRGVEQKKLYSSIMVWVEHFLLALDGGLTHGCRERSYVIMSHTILSSLMMLSLSSQSSSDELDLNQRALNIERH